MKILFKTMKCRNPLASKEILVLNKITIINNLNCLNLNRKLKKLKAHLVKIKNNCYNYLKKKKQLKLHQISII